jgi:thiamine-monophosphate kinase
MAIPGDGLYTTGPLGLARCGRRALQDQDDRFPELVQRFRQPRARFDAAAILATHGVRCVMDISDGLAGDAAHIARASKVSIHLAPGISADHPDLKRFCGSYGLKPEEEVLAGGEDYELLFSCHPETFAAIQRHLPEAHAVGQVKRFTGEYLPGLPEDIRSFRHG